MGVKGKHSLVHTDTVTAGALCSRSMSYTRVQEIMYTSIAPACGAGAPA